MLVAFAFSWQTQAQCDYTLEMNDSYGDSWNGNTMDVLVGGVVVLDDVTVSSGSQATETITVNTGDEITTVWNGGGSYGSETSYRILDAGGTQVGSATQADISTAIVASCPSCTAPTALTATDLTATTATLGWTAGGTETTWEIVVQADGTGEPTGSGTAVATTAIHSATGLTASTAYEVYYRADCTGGDYSAWVGPVDFTTPCVAVATFSENFDGVSTGTLPDCWSKIVTSASSYSKVETSTSYDQSAPNSVRMYASSDTSATMFLVSPGVTTLGSAYRLTLKAVVDDVACAYSVGTITDPTDSTTFTALYTNETLTATNSAESKIYDFSAYSGSDSYVAIQYHPSYYDTLYLDDMVWEAVPSCPVPNTLTATNITATSADLGWTAGGTETTWNVEYGADGFTQGAGTTVAVTANPYTLSGLTESTTYDYYVRADCGSGDTSPWAGPFSFTTPASCLLPSGIAFDSSVSPNLTATTAAYAWTASDSAETAWEIVVQLASADEPAANAPAGTGTAVTTTPAYQSTGLTAETNYEVYYRADCGAGDFSEWVGPYSFTTPCAVVTPDYTQDFTTYLDTCWSEATGLTSPSGTTSGWGVEEFAHTSSSGGGAVNFNIYGTGGNEWLLTPIFDLSAGGYEINLDVALTGYNATTSQTIGADDAVYIMQSIDGGTTWTTIYTWDASNSPSNTGDNVSIDVSAVTSATVQFGVFALEGSTSGGDMDFHVDNFAVRTPPLCLAPTSQTATSITATSADLGWTAGGTETTWNVEWGATGFTQGAGIMVTGATANPHALTGLTESTAYDFYVQADCGSTDGTSTWVGPFNFSTPASCLVPSAMQFDSSVSPNLTTTSAAYSWTASASAETAWEIVVQLATEDTPAIASGTGVAVTTTPAYQSTGLTENTAYEVYYRADCGAGDFSEWVGPITFSTLLSGAVCESAIAIASLPYTTSDNTANYGDDYSYSPGSSSCGTTSSYLNGDDVVYEYTATADGSITIDLSNLGSSYSGMFVYADCADIGTACLAGIGNSSTDDRSLDVAVTNGNTYYIVISTWATPQSTTYTLDVTFVPAPPSNNDCAAPIALTFGVATAATNSNATASSNTPACNDTNRLDVWFSFNTGASTAIDAIVDAGYYMQLWSGTACGSLTAVTNGCGATTLDNIAVTASTTYFIQVWSDSTSRPLNYETNASGAFNIQVGSQVLSSDDDLELEEGFTFFPNPVNNMLNVSANNAIEQLQLVNMLGQVVKSVQPNHTSYQLDMTELATGVYFIKAIVNGTEGTYRVLKK